MTPYDGSGYGISMYWRNQMKEIAEKNNETCRCWSSNEPLICFNEGNDLTITIECPKKTEECKTNFNVTEVELVNKFKVFYKV